MIDPRDIQTRFRTVVTYPGKSWKVDVEKLIGEIYAITGTSPEGGDRSPQDVLKEWARRQEEYIGELKEEISDLKDEKEDLERQCDRLEELSVFEDARQHLIAGRLGDAIREIAREHPDLRDLEYLYERAGGGRHDHP